jgi:ABC-type transport system substrate-binding protein
MLEALENVDQFTQAGIDIEYRYHSTISASYDHGWLDPLDTGKFGPEARYYSFDIAEALKLLDAAGVGDGTRTTLYASDIQRGNYQRDVALVAGPLHEIGIDAQIELIQDGGDYIPLYHYAYTGNYWGAEPTPGFNGIFLRKGDIQYPNADKAAYTFYHKNGASFVGASPTGDRPDQGDPEINSLIDDIRAEFDPERQLALLHDFQRMQAERAYRIPFPGYSSKALSLVWPAIGNYGVFRGPPGYSDPGFANYWHDTSQPGA